MIPKVRKAIEGLSQSDIFEKTIMKKQDYSLMPDRMLMGVVYPTEICCQNVGFPVFSQCLGKISK